MPDSWPGNAARGLVVVAVEAVALTLTAYAGLVAFVMVPPGMGGGSEGSPGRAILGIGALVISIVLPTAGFLCAALFWQSKIWLYRAAAAMGVMAVIWIILFAAYLC